MRVTRHPFMPMRISRSALAYADGLACLSHSHVHSLLCSKQVPASDMEALKSPLMGLFEKRRAHSFFRWDFGGGGECVATVALVQRCDCCDKCAHSFFRWDPEVEGGIECVATVASVQICDWCEECMVMVVGDNYACAGVEEPCRAHFLWAGSRQLQRRKERKHRPGWGYLPCIV